MKKKKITLVLALISLFSIGVHAQTSIILSPEIGIQSSSSKHTGDADVSEDYQGAGVNYSSVFAYQGGVIFGVQFAGNWALLTGAKYNQKGSKVTIESRDPSNPFLVQLPDGSTKTDVGEFSVTTRHNWLSIPVLARGQFGGDFKFGLAIGPQFNMGIGEVKETAEYSFENTNLSTDEFTSDFGTSTTSPLKKSHVSLLILPYVSYQLSKSSSIKLSMMIERGSDMVNDHYVVSDLNGSQRNVDGTVSNRQFGVMLGYEHRFDLKAGVKY